MGLDRWRRWAMIGCGGVAALCLALPWLPYLVRLGSLTLAEQRWQRNGGPDYTIVVSQGCFCPDPGRYRLTVRHGQVAEVEAYTPLGGCIRANPANFQHLTVAAAFRNARRALSTNWKAPWFSTLYVKYDPKAFDHLTVEAALARAEQAIRGNWLPDWDRRLIVEYDPALGYVTHFETADRRAAHFYFVYEARDVELDAP